MPNEGNPGWCPGGWIPVRLLLLICGWHFDTSHYARGTCSLVPTDRNHLPAYMIERYHYFVVQSIPSCESVFYLPRNLLIIILMESLKGFDILNELDGISCPTLIIGDRSDRVLSVQASEEIESALKGKIDVTLYLYNGYGHAVYDMAADYKERILEFLLA